MTNTIGEILKNTRKEQNLSLEEIAQKTRVRIYYLQSLENNKLDVFPSKAQGRGFLRIYAEFLGLPASLLIDAWDTNQVNLPDPEKLKTPPIEKEEKITPDLHDQEQGLIQEITAQPEPIPVALEQESEEEIISEKSSLPFQQKHLPVDKKIRNVAEEKKPPTPKADAIFKEIGQTLKLQRESLGLSLIDIERYTHIRLHYLQAIEDGDLSKLPSPVQGKGMIDNYSRFLDLDSSAILMRFADGLQTQRAERQTVPLKPKEKTSASTAQKTKKSGVKYMPAWRRILTPDLLIGSSIILLVVIFAVWGTSRIISEKNASLEATAPSISDVLLETPDATADLSSTSTQIPAIVSGTPDSIFVDNQETNILGEDTAQNTAENTGEEAAISETLAVTDNNPLQVYIVARQRAYLNVVVDGAEEFNGRVSPGNAYPFSGIDSIEVTTGNAAALQIFFNQNDLGTIGSFGQVSRLIFTKTGIITPTPLFTDTPTPTIQPSITLEPTVTMEPPTVTPLVPQN